MKDLILTLKRIADQYSLKRVCDGISFDAWDESKHPRGNQKNAGQFAKKGQAKGGKLEDRVSGDDLLNAKDLIDTLKQIGAKVSDNGYVSVYHRTSPENAEQIRNSGTMKAKEDGLFFSTKRDGGQNEGFGNGVVEMSIPAEQLKLDDLFDDEAHLRLPITQQEQAKGKNMADYIVPATEQAKREAKGSGGSANTEYHNPHVTPEQDAAYTQAVEKGDHDTALKMVREAAAKAMPNTKVVGEDGLPMVLYHGTTHNFNTFNGGAFFTADYMNADGYGNGERVVEAFVDMKEPLIVDCNGRKWDDLNIALGTTTQKIVENQEIMASHDGVIFKNIKDNWIDDEDYQDSDTVFYLSQPSQIKSADITYDDQGKVIPLSKRFNPNSNDIRF